MADEKQTNPQSQEESSPRASRSARSQQRRNQRSVFQYIAVLFAAAFVLLLFTFMMERRQNDLLLQENEEQIDNLQQSVSAVQSLQNLYAENDELKQQVADLEAQIAELEAAGVEKDEALSALSDQLTKTKAAMDWFWQLDEAFVRGRYNLCRELIQALQTDQLIIYLPEESITDNGRFSPYDRYREIYDAVY